MYRIDDRSHGRRDWTLLFSRATLNTPSKKSFFFIIVKGLENVFK